MSLGLLQVVLVSSIGIGQTYYSDIDNKGRSSAAQFPPVSLNSNDNYSYCPPGIVDQDTPSGIIEGEWRREKENILGLRDIEH